VGELTEIGGILLSAGVSFAVADGFADSVGIVTGSAVVGISLEVDGFDVVVKSGDGTEGKGESWPLQPKEAMTIIVMSRKNVLYRGLFIKCNNSGIF